MDEMSRQKEANRRAIQYEKGRRAAEDLAYYRRYGKHRISEKPLTPSAKACPNYARFNPGL